MDGNRKLPPGAHFMPAAEYHADPCPLPSLSSSIARILVNQSPMHAWLAHPRLNPGLDPEESSRLDLGSAAHAVLLESDWNVVEEVVADDWRTKAARERRAEVRAAGKIPVLSKHHEVLRAMVPVAQMCISQSELAGIFEDGYPEETLIWQDDDGIWCRCRPDWRTQDRMILLDYKTTANAEPNAFTRHILNMGYDMQAAFYLRGNRAIGAPDGCKFVFLAQEIEPPYACSLVGVAPSLLCLGDMKVERAIRTWASCMQNDSWPAYPPRIAWAEAPEWAARKWSDFEQSETEDA